MNHRIMSICLTAVVLAGCVGGATQTVRSYLPGQLSNDQPLLPQVSKTYSAGLLAKSGLQDRYHNQSLGLGLISHAEAERFINQHLDRLKQASGVKGLPGQAYLFADTAFGARASPEGNIYIAYAVLKDLETTDELAALLAHELAHTIRNHHSSDAFVILQKKVVMGAGWFANLKKSDSGVLRRSDEKLIENTFAALMVSDGFINPGWTRHQELEADKLGVDLMLAAGYNIEAMFSLLDKMASWEAKNKAQQVERNALVDGVLTSANVNFNGIPFGEALNSWVDNSAVRVGALLNRLNQDHDSAETRYDALLTYADQHYVSAPSPPQESSDWQRIVNGRQSKNIWSSLTQVMDARESMAKAKLATSESLILSATNADTHNQNFLRQSFYELRSEQGKKSSMAQNLAFGLNGEYPSIKMHIEHTRLSADQNSPPNLSSTKNLLSVFDQYGRPPAYYHQVIALAQTAGLGGEATRLVLECVTRYAGDGFQCSAESAANTETTDLSYGSMVNSLFKAK